ncbi:hypothetical protein E4U35_007704 [Claviceps purpurea]|nr:hypothetical protein E4U38_006695 [Claviceps purpurea]KAG6149104.1 hypothetical protein E4U37_007043 [Claviceps purpurea]KAG6162229.1 hypothetical protein E4U51_006559 [Claviceps purpurea]KAG6174841.1 hypothetical protein E4U27_006400 [Claviceps purpurea]KAG6178316.1 hypothetical protein E4U36_006533 [Claviceps purpurea]
MPANSLPSHSKLLSSLISSLHKSDECLIQQSSQAADDAQPKPQSRQNNTTSRHRSLLLTLHVLFPSIVLPALELVDSQLVARLQLEEDMFNCEPGPCLMNTSEGRVREYSQVEDESSVFGQSSFSAYAVQPSSLSAAIQLPEPLRINAVSDVNIVHLAAWNCSCDDFHGSKVYHRTVDERWGAHASNAYSSGLDGKPGASGEEMACCKHLLACLVVEILTGSQTNSSVVSKPEIATVISGLRNRFG